MGSNHSTHNTIDQGWPGEGGSGIPVYPKNIRQNTQNSSKYTQNYTQVYLIPEIQRKWYTEYPYLSCNIPYTRFKKPLYTVYPKTLADPDRCFWKISSVHSFASLTVKCKKNHRKTLGHYAKLTSQKPVDLTGSKPFIYLWINQNGHYSSVATKPQTNWSFYLRFSFSHPIGFFSCNTITSRNIPGVHGFTVFLVWL